MPNKVLVHFIDHSSQRYDTAGDYWESDGGQTWNFRISLMSHWTSEVLCLMHELTEKILCTRRSISDAEIDKFDMSPYAKTLSDPGLSKRAPYHKEHLVGMKIEKLLCKELGIPWRVHAKNYERLTY